MAKPSLFGILNITPDSFSDGGKYLASEAAVAQARHLMDSGADALDIGAASSNVDASPVSPDVEIARMAPVVAEARKQGWPVSIDSFSSEVQAWALGEGVAYINDIQGFADPALYPRLASTQSRLIVMHSVQGRGKATREDIAPDAIMARVFDFFDTRLDALERAGVARTRMILDPGMGFFLGSDPEVSLTVLRGIGKLKARYTLPVLISVSRKSFLRKLTGRDVRDVAGATLAAELASLRQGADMIRTHDPAALRDALTIWGHIEPGFSL